MRTILGRLKQFAHSAAAACAAAYGGYVCVCTRLSTIVELRSHGHRATFG